MLTQLLSLVLLVGLTATTLLLCAEKWGWLQAWEVLAPRWLFRYCILCAGYWIAVGQLLVVIVAAVVVGQLSSWYWVGAALPLALPAAAVSRVLFGLSAGR